MPLYFIHISDTHFGPTKNFEHYGSNAFDVARRMVETINALPVDIDFVMHTGDVTDYPDRATYTLAEEAFSRLKPPIYFVTGNHDTSLGINTHLTMGAKTDCSSDQNIVSYSFEKKGFRFITLDSRGPDEIDPRGVLPLHQFDFLEREIHKDDKPFVVFIHFLPFTADSLWLDEGMLLLNGGLLHETLLPVRHRVRGVFFGHVHRGMQLLKDGILYSSVGSIIGQLNTFPGDAKATIDFQHPPCFNLVTLINGKTIIKEHSIPKSS
jgi:3',5'-cyclic AMP phosphodiesterase CpdA